MVEEAMTRPEGLTESKELESPVKAKLVEVAEVEVLFTVTKLVMVEVGALMMTFLVVVGAR